MNERHKTFNGFEELEDDKQIKYEKFYKFNEFLEKNGISSYDDIYYSYIRVFNELNGTNFIDYTELDFQIKYLIEEKKVVVTRILEFAELKFSYLNKLLLDLFSEIDIFAPITKIGDYAAMRYDNFDISKVVDKILKEKKGNFVIIMKEQNSEQRHFHIVNFDFRDNIMEKFKVFKKDLMSFNLDEEFKKNDVLPFGIAIT